MPSDGTRPTETERVEPGEPVYDRTGTLLGHISGVSADGFEVEIADPDGSHQEELPGKEFGEGYLVCQCGECGELGDLDDGFPDACPNCGAPKEEIAYYTED